MFIDEQRERFAVEPICRVVGVSASAYYQRATGARSARRVEDERLLELIRELHRRNYFAYGSWRMWRALLRAGEEVGRGRVERLMRANGIQGAKQREKPWRTTYPNAAAYRPADLVERDFAASRPDELWFADFTLRVPETRFGVLGRMSAGSFGGHLLLLLAVSTSPRILGGAVSI